MGNRELTVAMRGDLGAHLVAFCDRLGMKRRGRLDDVYDQEFGNRTIDLDGAGAELTLWRGFEDSHWSVDLRSREAALPASLVDQVRHDVLAAAAEAGMVIVGQHFSVNFSEDLTPHLDAFRDRLGLDRRGDVDARWDTFFGFAEITTPDATGELVLVRTKSWFLRLDHIGAPLPDARVTELWRQAHDAAAEFGASVVDQDPPATVST